MYIDDVIIECSIIDGCKRYKNRLNEFKGKTLTTYQIKEKTKVLMAEGLLNNLRIKVFQQDGKIRLIIKLDPRRLVRDIKISSSISDLDYAQIIKIFPYRINDVLDAKKTRDSRNIIRNYLLNKNITVKDIVISSEYKADKVDLNIWIDVKKVIRISKIVVRSSDSLIKKKVKLIFYKYKGNIYDPHEIKREADGLIDEMNSRGYFNFMVDIKEHQIKKNQMGLELIIKIDEALAFNFIGNNIFTREELLSHLRPYIKNNLGKFTIDEIKKMLIDKYEQVGVYNTRIFSRFHEGENKLGRKYINFYLKIDEGRKIPISEIVYYGNEKRTKLILNNLYDESSSSLASNGYIDKNYLQKFSKKIREHYLKDGYAFVNVSDPRVVFLSDRIKAKVEYVIREKQQTILEKINIFRISLFLGEKIKKRMTNKDGEPINIVAVQKDLQTVIQEVKNSGYYFAQIDNNFQKKLLSFSPSHASVNFNIHLIPGKKIILQNIVIAGNVSTKSIVVEREVNFLKGDLVTPIMINKIKENLSYIGLFSNIKITPVIKSRKKDTNIYYADLFIELKERDFGMLEFAPGYRTDIGIKLSSSILYNNWMGMNRSWSFKLEANQRLDFNNFDDKRKREEKRMLEYSAKMGFGEPYLFNYPLAFDFEVSRTRKRYYSFDANISRVSTLFTKLFFDKKLITLLRYKLEEIKPFDATNLKDQEHYKIGSITPIIATDFRDKNINPQKGFYSRISLEYAHPTFLSRNDRGLEINFIKLVTRNKIYFSVKDITVASFVSLGYQKNLVKEKYINLDGSDHLRGYIPSREVFRLDGIDTVRGFDDTEINRLLVANDIDISKSTIIDTAYFANYKIEPRYMFDDNLMIGVFFDAGRVFINSFSPFKVRTSMGISFKILTPVGTLDFDYGVKLQRKSYSDNKRDSFGRFHLSIGYF